ncbi:hypothetical protein [Streptomyces subrutilus]|uniref:Uncharacterized protein n=1 Tax=Streptomyces subrutilus TaxID=36818 RepID=A0A5P2UEF3_9ACTN|nr:hypothetical protein [Streptomyces subrutilus]QEU77592.1 hypothetical protein CP968_04205 [Streptomyces subrutilus]WSJ33309.1 hypothetical protein OG479_30640 [Streptomyces subrutilus]GGZ64471.1 hypothetical protein GCM10010371_25080 [Streptomyces subrutilus]
MIFTVLLVPPLLLCVMLALGRYEEHMLDPDRLADSAPQRHLNPVPETDPELPPAPAPAPAPARPTSRAA